MRHIYLANAFSLQMLQTDSARVDIYKVSAVHVRDYLYGRMAEFVSAIGHGDTARVVSGLLNPDDSDFVIDVETNRVNVILQPKDLLIVAQVTGGRLPEGATTLPEGVTIQFFFVQLI